MTRYLRPALSLLIVGAIWCAPAFAQQENPNPNPAYAEAGKYIEKNNLDKALEIVNQGIIKDPKCGELYQLRCELLKGKGKYPEALNDAGKAVEFAMNPRTKALAYRCKASAERHLKLKAEAEADFKMSLKLEPNDPISNFEFGGFLYIEKRIPEAIVYLRNAKTFVLKYRQRKPRELDLLLSLAEQENEISNRWPEFETKDPNPAGPHLAKGSVLFEQGKVQASLDEYDKAINASSSPNYQSFAYVCKGLIKYSSKLQDDYLLDFKKAVELAPSSPTANREYGEHLLKDGQRELGIRHLELAKEMYLNGMKKVKSGDKDTLSQQANSDVIRIDTLLKMAKSGYRKKSPAYTEARNLIENRESAKAMEVLNNGILENPANGELYQLRGELYFEKHNYQEAFANAQKAVELAGDNNSKSVALLGKAKAESYLQMIEDADRDYKEAIELDPNNHMCQCIYGEFLLTQHRTLESIPYLQKASDLAHANNLDGVDDIDKLLEIAKNAKVNAIFYKAKDLSRLNKDDEAMKILDQGIIENPDATQLYYLRGAIFAYQKKYPEAIKDQDKVIEMSKDKFLKAGAYLNKALIAVSLKIDADAEEFFKKALELEPSLEEAHLKYSEFLAGKGRNEESADHSQKALQLGVKRKLFEEQKRNAQSQGPVKQK